MSKGKILLVGFGPGAEEHMTLRALEAIKEADVVIGYTTYIKLVKHLLEGKEVVRKGMTEEVDRCIEAYDQAKLGKTVALISSGDIGVYGMAGPTYEVLFNAGWTPESEISVEIVPGSTALSACASLVGAPLTHDFCSISLSDLLTPWPTIANRIDAAGRSDFVIALYNPKSGRRTQQIVEAQRILLQYRKADTPVAIVKSAYRRRQEIQIVRLDEMKDCKIGMLTTVLIGNSSSYLKEGLMITPRGYANKYEQLTGEAKEGEEAGRSLTMGLINWKSCLREHMRNNPKDSLQTVYRFFNMPMSEILSGISEASEEDLAGNFSATEVAEEKLEKLLVDSVNWGNLRAVVRSEAGAVTEIMIKAEQFRQKGDWLNIENDYCHLHIDWSRVQRAWFVSRGDSLRSVHFVDALGNLVFNISLRRQEGQFAAGCLEAYETAQGELAKELEAEILSGEEDE